jgi:hypothetical protein
LRMIIIKKRRKNNASFTLGLTSAMCSALVTSLVTFTGHVHWSRSLVTLTGHVHWSRSLVSGRDHRASAQGEPGGPGAPLAKPWAPPLGCPRNHFCLCMPFPGHRNPLDRSLKKPVSQADVECFSTAVVDSPRTHQIAPNGALFSEKLTIWGAPLPPPPRSPTNPTKSRAPRASARAPLLF